MKRRECRSIRRKRPCNNERSFPSCRCSRLNPQPALMIDTVDNYCRAHYLGDRNILMKSRLPFAEFAMIYLRCTSRLHNRDSDSDDDDEPVTRSSCGTEYIHHAESELCMCCNATFTIHRVCVYCDLVMQGYIRAIYLVRLLISHNDIASIILATLMRT